MAKIIVFFCVNAKIKKNAQKVSELHHYNYHTAKWIEKN